MKRSGTKNIIFVTMLALAAASLIMVSVQLCYYAVSMHEMERSINNIVSIEAKRASEQLVVQLRKAERTALALALSLDTAPMSDAAVGGELEKALAAHPHFFAAGVAYAPSGDAATPKFHIAEYARDGGAVHPLTEDPAYDYTREDWYNDPAGKTPRWTEPYMDKKTGEFVAAFIAPFHRGQAAKAGVVFVEVSLDTVRDVATGFRFGDTGYGYILSKKGIFLYHPIRAASEGGKTIFEVLSAHKTRNSEKILETTRKALQGTAEAAIITNPESGERFRLFYQPIAATGWTLGAVFSDDEMAYGSSFFRKQKMWIVFWSVIFLTLLVAILVRADKAKPGHLWVVSAAFSVLCVGGIFYIWYLTLSAPLIEEKSKLIFTDVVSLNRFIESNSKEAIEMKKKAPVYIPTGIYIQSLEFAGANDLLVTGYIWQKYADGLHDNVRRGFIMPEARTITSLKEAYRRKAGKVETIGWYFEATIRQQFDYSRYPFDRPNIWIWLRHVDFMNNVILVPDLNSYKFIAPAQLPGLQEELALPGYTFLGSFFDHEYHLRRTDFGMASRGAMDRFPEFYYNIIVKRNFITPFVSKLFPLLIMFSILFVVQLMFSQDEEKKKAFGLSAFAVMGVVITFFFSTLLSHTNLRQELGADRIIFIENFHFIAYFILLLATIKALLFIGGKPIHFIHYKNGLIPKLLYWPLFTSLIFVVSFIHFY